MTEHIVSSYDDDLKEISDGVINMGDEVLGALNNIETLLKNNDHELAKKIIKNDLIINDLGQSVENKVFNILASRQPMAIDLRIVFSAVKISLYLERCGDMCKGISNRVLKGDLNEAQSPETISLLVNMCSMVHSNLGIVMEDYSKKECDNSVKVWKSDSEIDSLYSEILMDILNSIKTNPDATDALVPLLFIARYLERVGDQATMVSTDNDIIVNEFALHQNYPNPFNPQTTIKFSLPEAQLVNLSVYNMLGQQVLTLVDRELPAGYHTAKWYAGNIASGVYIYRLTSNGKSLTQKMLLMK